VGKGGDEARKDGDEARKKGEHAATKNKNSNYCENTRIIIVKIRE
jgi:hypothetical protein